MVRVAGSGGVGSIFEDTVQKIVGSVIHVLRSRYWVWVLLLPASHWGSGILAAPTSYILPTIVVIAHKLQIRIMSLTTAKLHIFTIIFSRN